MKQAKLRTGGTSITLETGDPISSMPTAFRSALPPRLEDAFKDPKQFLGSIANSTACGPFRSFLHGCIEQDRYELVVVDPNFPFPITISALKVIANGGKECFLHPQECGAYAGKLPEVFSHIKWINWGGLGCSGELLAENSWLKLTDFVPNCKHLAFSDTNTKVFASSPCGDLMACNTHGQAGFVNHETANAYEFGTLSEMVDWIFDGLQTGRSLEFDGERCDSAV